MPPRPTESSILNSFLLNPASLPEIISYSKFVDLFPRSQQTNPQIKTLYRELQHQRNIDIELVSENIEREIQRGERQKTELRRVWQAQQHQGGVGNGDDEDTAVDAVDQMEVEMDGQLFAQTANLANARAHSLQTILPDMEEALQALETEIAEIDEQKKVLLEQMKATLGGLSDLRYGTFSKPVGGSGNIAEEATNAMRMLQDVCKSA